MSHSRRRLSHWFKSSTPTKRAARRLSFDALEDRRLLTAGSLDPTFGTGGEVSTIFPYTQPSSDSGNFIVAQPDGKYIVGGSTSSGDAGAGTSSDFVLTRYNANGTLDASFGTDGEAIANFGLTASNPTPIITGLTLTSSGQIVAVGDVTSPDQDILVARFNSNGSLDTSFHGTGMVLTAVGATMRTSGVAVQPDGRIVVGATVTDGSISANSEMAVLRYNADGSLDTSFGSGGIATALLDGKPAGVSALALQSDGRIVVGGVEGITDEPEMLQSAAAASPLEFALVRFNSNGTVDRVFGNGGEVTTPIDSGAYITALAIQPDGEIVAGGNTLASSERNGSWEFTFDDFALARYSTFGILDTSFGHNGIVTTDFDGRNDKLVGLVIQANGQIVAAGASTTSADEAEVDAMFPVTQPSVPAGPANTFVLARYNVNGSLDTTYGSGGEVTTDTGGGNGVANAVGLQPDGDVLVVGTSDGLRTSSSLAMVEYTSSGSLDSAFANNGIDLLHISSTVVTDGEASAGQTVVQPDGKILVLGFAQTVDSQWVTAIARYNPDGTLDTAFGTGGTEMLSQPQDGAGASLLALAPDGQIILAGSASTASGLLQYMVARLNSDGSPDPTFGNQGVETFIAGGGGDEPSGLAVQPDGKIVLVGSASPVQFTPGISGGSAMGAIGGGISGEELIRLNTDGSLDTSFANGGVEGIPGGFPFAVRAAVAVQTDGKIVVADSELLRFNPDGSVDTTFGDDGSVALAIGTGPTLVDNVQLVQQPDGKLLVVGSYNSQGESSFELLRFKLDGSIDSTFNGGSPVIGSLGPVGGSGISNIVLENGGKIVLGGSVYNSQLQTTVATIFQYNTDGTLDTSFGNQGETQLSALINDLAVDASGDIIAVGGNSDDFEVFRFEDAPPNSPDTPITLPIAPPIVSPVINPEQTIGTISPPPPDGHVLQIPQPVQLPDPLLFSVFAPILPPIAQPISLPTQPVTTPQSLSLTATGNDQLVLTFIDATDFTVSLDGQTTTYSTSQYNAINFSGATGSTAVVSGALGSAGVVFTANSVAINGAGFTININDTDTIYVYGNNSQMAQLNGGGSGNTLVVLPGYSEMYGTGFADFAAGFGQTYGYSAGPQDTAYFYAGSGNTFASAPTYSYLSTGGSFSAADGFSSILAAAAADGSGQAWLYGATTGTNSFVANNQYSYMSGAGFFNEVTGFDAVKGVSGSSSDYAYLNDTIGGNSFSSYSTYSFLAGANFNYQAMGFANIVAAGTTSDEAAVYDSSPVDTIQQNGPQVTLTKANGSAVLNSFGEVAGHVATADDPNHEVDYFYHGLGS